MSLPIGFEVYFKGKKNHFIINVSCPQSIKGWFYLNIRLIYRSHLFKGITLGMQRWTLKNATSSHDVSRTLPITAVHYCISNGAWFWGEPTVHWAWGFEHDGRCLWTACLLGILRGRLSSCNQTFPSPVLLWCWHRFCLKGSGGFHCTLW